MSGIDGFKVYIATPDGTWITVPYKEENGMAILESDLAPKLPLNVFTTVYVKAFAGVDESPSVSKRLFNQAVAFTYPGRARVTQQISQR